MPAAGFSFFRRAILQNKNYKRLKRKTMKVNSYSDFEECRYLWELVDEMVDWLHHGKSRQLVLPTYCDDEYYLANHENCDGGVPIVMHVEDGRTKETTHPIGWEELKYALFEILLDENNDCDGIEYEYL